MTNFYNSMFSFVRNRLGMVETGNPSSLTNKMVRRICGTFPKFCNWYLKFMSDSHPEVNNAESIGKFLTHYPAGCSIKTLQHLTQLEGSCGFGYFDYGVEENWKRYKSLAPPQYPINLIRVPIALVVGQYDLIVNPETVKWFNNQLEYCGNDKT